MHCKNDWLGNFPRPLYHTPIFSSPHPVQDSKPDIAKGHNVAPQHNYNKETDTCHRLRDVCLYSFHCGYVVGLHLVL